MEFVQCEWDGCLKEGKYYEEHKLTLCSRHRIQHEDELYWELFYEEHGIGAYAGQKPKFKSEL
jgi:hypothetical protein